MPENYDVDYVDQSRNIGDDPFLNFGDLIVQGEGTVFTIDNDFNNLPWPFNEGNKATGGGRVRIIDGARCISVARILSTSNFSTFDNDGVESNDKTLIGGFQVIDGFFDNKHDFSNSSFLVVGPEAEFTNDDQASYSSSTLTPNATVYPPSTRTDRTINQGLFTNKGVMKIFGSDIVNSWRFINSKSGEFHLSVKQTKWDDGRFREAVFYNQLDDLNRIERYTQNSGKFYISGRDKFWSKFINEEGLLFSNESSGLLDLNERGMFTNHGHMYNSGTFNLSGRVFVSGGESVFVNNENGIINISETGEINAADGEFINRGDINFGKNTSSNLPVITGDLYHGGDEGTGTFRAYLHYTDFGRYQGEDISTLSVTGDVALSGSLELDIPADASLGKLKIGQFKVLIAVEGSLTGYFKNLPEGALVHTIACPPQSSDCSGQSHDLRITYTAGVKPGNLQGNDIALYVADNGDDLLGTSNKDTLRGTISKDYISAGSGEDELYGGLGSDVLTGGEGSDRFVYGDINESAQGSQSRDVITDFSSSEDDKIDISSIADDSVFIGSSDFTGTKPEIRFDDGILQLATPEFYTPIFKFYEPDSAPTPVFEIQLLGVDSLSVDDLIL